MNGMRYMLPKFSCPASTNTSELKWDYAFLSKEDFVKKYGQKMFDKLSSN